MIEIEIDKLTNSIENAISGDSFETELLVLEKNDLKQISKRKGWLFDWKKSIIMMEGKFISYSSKGIPLLFKDWLAVQKTKDFTKCT